MLNDKKLDTAISIIQQNYNTKISNKKSNISKLVNERENIRSRKTVSISDTKQLYNLEKSIELLESDINKLNNDMKMELSALYQPSRNRSVNSKIVNINQVDSVVSSSDSGYVIEDVEEVDTPPEDWVSTKTTTIHKPWDMRLYRAYVDKDNTTNIISDVIPYNISQSCSSVDGYYPSDKTIDENRNNPKVDKDALETLIAKKKAAQNDISHKGVYSINNPYALITLYGSKGGEYLMDKRNRRSWYEVDNVNNKNFGFAKNPSTTNIVSWGNADPYGRTPYQFSDFVLSKYWNVMPNNRLITLRRFSAPVLDNLNFPGMDGITEDVGDVNVGTSTANKVQFPPIATAITYFGDETENKLSSILKFSSGLPWEDLESDIWKPETVDPGQEGFETSFGLSSILGKLNIFGGNWDFNAAMRKGVAPPDPYKDGPYANRVIGPVNAIKSVKKRKQGINFAMDGLNIIFEYKARPIGGVNTKAVMLDILSNFLVMGTSNAIFFGGAHRFLSSPKGYPFIGGDEGKQAFYRGDAVKFAGSMIQEATRNSTNIFDGVKDIMKNLLDAVTTLDFNKIFGNDKDSSGNRLLDNATKGYMASRAKDAVPHLSGMRALLIGEPVGEWHLTVGNPLNPIALIGNLICEGIEVEFGDELGPDDFPLDIKVKVNLKHGMARDKDAIQSIFNRGYGRIYSLPDNLITSSDKATHVDAYTNPKDNNSSFYTSDDFASGSGVQIGTSNYMYGAKTEFSITDNPMQGSSTAWNRLSFDFQPTDSTISYKSPSINNRTIYRDISWIAESALK